MALQTTGAISMDDIHIEAGGASGTTCTLDDSDIRGLTAGTGYVINSTPGTTISLGDFYGASGVIVIRTVAGSYGTSYPIIGAFPAYLLSSSQSSDVGTLPSGFTNVGQYLNNVQFYGWAHQSFPGTGSPHIEIFYNNTRTAPSSVNNLTLTFKNITDGYDSIVLPLTSSGFSAAQTAGTVPSGMSFSTGNTLGSPYTGNYSNARTINLSVYSSFNNYQAFNGPSGSWNLSQGLPPTSGETIDLVLQT